MNEPTNQETRNWLMFLIRPADLLRLFQLLGGDGGSSDGTPTFRAAHFPPDTRIHGAAYDAERGYFLMVLESAFFEPVAVSRDDEGRWSAAWNQLIFNLNEVENEADIPDEDLWTEAPAATVAQDEDGDDEGDDETGPGAPISVISPNETRQWQAYFITPAQILGLLRHLADGRKIGAPAPSNGGPFPPDARLVFGTYDDDRDAFGLILESEDFAPITVTPAGNDALRLAIPERELDIHVDSDKSSDDERREG